MVQTQLEKAETAASFARERPWPAWLTPVLWAAVVVCLWRMFATMFREMWVRWFPAWHYTHLDLYDRIVGGESYYTHGPLVPLVSVVITLLLIRHVRVPVRPTPKLGGLVLGGSLLLHLAASLARVNFISGFAFIGVLCGLMLVFWGGLALRRLWFPLAFLFFMVPLPEFTIADLNFYLKMAAAAIGVDLANLFGVYCSRSGNQVFLWCDEGYKQLVVANVCNGLRTLISLLAFGALYAFICKLRGAWRVVLFVMSVGVALVANSLRILALLLVAHIWDEEAATGWFHDTSGMLIFVLAFLLMFAIEKAILGLRALVGRPAKLTDLFAGQLRTSDDQGQWSRLMGSVSSRRGVACLMVLALSAGGVWWVNQHSPSTLTSEVAKKALPRTLTVDDVLYNSEDLPLTEQEQTILETRDYLYRRFMAGGQWVDFSIIFSQDNRKGTHPPDLCLEGSGGNIVYKQDVTVRDVPGRGDVRCRELITTQGIYVLYTYKCGQEYTSSFWRQQWVIWVNGLLHSNASGALIRIVVPMQDTDPEPARQRAAAFMRAGVPHIDKRLDNPPDRADGHDVDVDADADADADAGV